MKLTLTLFLSILFFTSTVSAQLFVKHDAAGANDGSSWTNAYTDLSDALANSSPNDEIWVAAGTYKPGSGTANIDTFYTFPHDLQLYGGFIGTETTLSERDWEANETILSGDHNDDDIDGNFDDNKTDNSKHVIWLTDTVTVASTIDGFTIRNGNTDPASGSGNDRRGGGILTYGAPAIRNCQFTQNYGYFGGALYPRGSTATGVIIEGCTFVENEGGFGAGIYLNATTGTLSNSTFTDNVVLTRGGALYNDASGGMTISNCSFSNNVALESRGGGVYNTASPSTYTDCDFIGNDAPLSSGGGLQVRNTSDDLVHITVTVNDCSFEGNNARFGGGLGSYDGLTSTVLNNCTFTGNTSTSVGGGLSNAFGAETIITNCTFNENTASASGGGIYSQNDSARVTIINSSMMSNTSDETGGAISISGDNEPGTTIPLPLLTVENTSLILNSSIQQGAGINISNGNLNMTNALIHLNAVVNPEGIGGGMSLNTSDSIVANFNILNSTIVDNSAFIGAGISHWRTDGSMEGSSELTFQNTILANVFGTNYEVEAGEPIATSNGGNLSQDLSMTTVFFNTNDLNGMDPLFVDYPGGDFHLLNDSPCVDAGVATGAPAMDLEGNSRIDEVDMGAFENQKLVSVSELEDRFGQIDIFPNPVEDVLYFSFESDWNGVLNVSIVAADGKTISSKQINKIDTLISTSLNVENLPEGIYFLTFSNGGLSNTKSFKK